MMKIALREVFWRQEWEVFVYQETVDGGRCFMQPDGASIVLREHTVVSADLKPMFTINQNVASELIEELQKAGVRPKELTKIEGQYQAQSAHLEDLRNILRTRGIMKKEA